MRFRSLRWRIASFYAVLLLAVVAIVTIVLTFQLRAILFEEARLKVDRVGDNIAGVVRGDTALNAVGDAAPIETELEATGALDHWAGPTTFVEVDAPEGFPEAKSTNMGGATFAGSTMRRAYAVQYTIERRPPFGAILVRDEAIHFQGTALLVKVGESLDIYDETLARIRSLLVIVALLSAVVVIAGSFAIAASALEPIKRLGAAMGEIRSDRLSRRLGWSDRRDELGALAQTFDAMLDRLEDGFARERQFISDASHELKTPLTVINANAQMLERWADRDPAVRAESLRAIRDQSGELAGMVNGMLLLARAESGDGIPREPLVFAAVVGEAVAAARPRVDAKGLAFTFAVDARAHDARVLGDAALVRQLVTNLVDNAVKFTERGGIDVAVAVTGERATVEVADTGVGVDIAALDRIFDRFYRTDASRDRAVPGTGLGLAIVRSIARVHDGTVEAIRRPTGGTIFRVTLPTLTPLQ